MRSAPIPAVAASAAGARPWSRVALWLLGLLVLAHAGLVVATVAGLFPESVWNPVEVTDLRQVAGGAALGLVALAFGVRRAPVAAVSLAVATVAFALFLPGPVLVVAWLLLDAWLVGAALLDFVARHAPRFVADPLPSDAPALGGHSMRERRAEAAAVHDVIPELAVLCGLALGCGLLAATGAMRVHAAPVYAVALCVPLVLAPARLRAVAARLAAWRASDLARATWAERVWIAALALVAVMHLFVATKPDAGYDAQAMHLTFARLVDAWHAWHPDVSRFAWAVMPLGADWLFAFAYALGGEACAHLANVAFAALAACLLYRLAREHSGRASALAATALFAAAPLAFLVTGSLFADGLWCAFLLGTLHAAIAWWRRRDAASLAVLWLCAAGALQAKAISLLWLAPLALALVAGSRGAVLRVRSRAAGGVVAVATVIAAWPYASAWWRTGNPLFPFFNGVFRSPLMRDDASFANTLYHLPLLPWTPWALVMDGGRYIEGVAGAAGFQWLVLIPLLVLGLAHAPRSAVKRGCIALALVFFVAVYVQQAYLRYLLPALLVFAAASAWAIDALPDRLATRLAVAVLGLSLVALDLRFMYTASWTNARLCDDCAFDARARADYLERYAPLRLIADELAARAPDARVGFFALNDPGPAGFTGYSRAANWHDLGVFDDIVHARDARTVLAIAQRYRLTHVVVRAAGEPDHPAIAQFVARYAHVAWEAHGYRVAVLGALPAVTEDAAAAR